MNEYVIEQKILTLARCAVMTEGSTPASFGFEGVKILHWDFNYREGWLTDAWLATSTIKAENYHKAFVEFNKKLSRLIPRVSLISQSYIEYLAEPFMIHRVGEEIVFFRYIKDRAAVGLMFMEKEQRALKILLEKETIPKEFYYYWKDAVNATGYSAKLLLMFSAIEALVKKDGKKDWNLINEILGDDIIKELFGTEGQSKTGLRNRLVHGEYFGIQDGGKDYLGIVHNKIINYFNTKVFHENLLNENVTNPQRHFFGNKEEYRTFIKAKEKNYPISLKDLLKDFNENDRYPLKNFEYIHDQRLIDTY